MRLSKYFYLPLLIACLAFVACDDDDDYKKGKETAADCPALTFGADNVFSEEMEPTEPTSYDITVYRENATDAASYSIIVLTNTDDAFVVPETVTFAAGQTEATITITFDDTEIGKEYSLEISLADDDVDMYSENAYQTFSFSVTRVKWNALGMCTYTDDFFTTFYGVGQVTWEVEIEERDDLPGYFRLVYPYDEKYIWNDPGDWDESKTYYLIVDATDPYGVFIPQQEIGVDWGYGMISVWSIADYDVQAGSTLADEKSAGNCGTYDETKGLITFPERTLLINMPDYSSGWYYANTNGWFMILMPGFALADYSVEIDYQGVNDNIEAVADITLGADVAYALVAVVEGTDVDGAASDIKSGGIASQQITASGTYSLPFTGEGMHTIVAVSYDEDGVAQETGSARFNYETGDPNEGWTSLGMCTYTDDFIASGWGCPCLTWEVEIQEKDDQPGLFRLIYPYDEKYDYNDPGDWDTSMDYNIEIDATDPSAVRIDQQDIGVDWGYGEMGVWCYGDYLVASGYSYEDVKDLGYYGTYANGVITFPEQCLLFIEGSYLYYANLNGGFKVVMPGASGVKAQKVSAAHQTINKSVKKSAKTLDTKNVAKKMIKKTAQPVK